MGTWADLAELAASQLGLVATWQAAERGINRQTLDYRAEEHGWTRVRRTVFLLPGHSLTPLVQLKAAELALAGAGIAAARAAAFAWELRSKLPFPMDFVVRPGCSRRPSGTRVRESAWLEHHEPVLRRGIRVPTADWTIYTCAEHVDVPELKRMIALADRKRLCPRSEVRATVEANRCVKGRRAAVQALDELAGEGLSHSELERLGRRRLLEAKLRPHGRPHLVLHRGKRVAELDIAFVDEKVGVPIDGPHHLDPDQKRADDDQRHTLTLLGWIIVPADEHRLVHQPQVFVRQVRAALEARRSPQVSGIPSEGS